MGSIVGFTICYDLPPERKTRVIAAQNRALSQFGSFERVSTAIGCSTLHIWGQAYLSNRTHTMPDGSTLALIGSPHNEVSWQAVQESLLEIDHPEDFVLPWEGRVILLQVSADGQRWTLWNDWLGSIPTYYAEIGRGRIVSTLEPVTVSAAGCTPNDFYMPGVVSLLTNGYFFYDWTLYKNIKSLLPDCAHVWDEHGYRKTQLWTVQASQARWETSWDDLVDEMYALSHQAIANILKTRSSWILPLSSGLDSRLIAGVAADTGTTAYTYAWGPAENIDVIYSCRIAKALGYPWKHIALPSNFLVEYTPHWFNMFGTSMHFQGMYLMSFLNEIQAEPPAPILNGFIGDALTGGDITEYILKHSCKCSQVSTEWFSDWDPARLHSAFIRPMDDAFEENAIKIRELIESYPGARFQKLMYLDLWSLERNFISYLSTLKDYWRGVATPFLDRSYARFCLSLPLAALDHRRLLGEVFRRYYGKLAVIPGTYGVEPYIVTGRHLIRKRITKALPEFLWNRLIKGCGNVQKCIDFDSLHADGKESLWPLFQVGDQLSEWLDMKHVEQDFQTVVRSNTDARPLRRLQAVQTFASAFLSSKN